MEQMNASKAISDFSKKLKAFVSSGEKDPHFKSENASLQEKITEREALRRSNIISYYKKFTTPDVTISEDEDNLMKAYALFKGLRALNQGTGDEHTFIKGTELISPLAQKARYTSGGDFVYLAAWFLFEKGIEDFAPVLEEKKDDSSKGAAIPSASFCLDFIPASKKAFSLHDREILGIIKNEFYQA